MSFDVDAWYRAHPEHAPPPPPPKPRRWEITIGALTDRGIPIDRAGLARFAAAVRALPDELHPLALRSMLRAAFPRRLWHRWLYHPADRLAKLGEAAERAALAQVLALADELAAPRPDAPDRG